MLLIGICGPSCSGKGVVTEFLAARNHQIIRICQDSYFRCWQDDLEVPQALMMDKLIDCVARLKRGQRCWLPYAGWTEQFTVCINDQDMKARPVVLVEGYLLFTDDNLADLFDLRVFIDVSPENMLYRRLKREGTLDNEVLSIGVDNIDKIHGHIIPRSLEFKPQQLKRSDAVVDGNLPKEVVRAHVVEVLNDFTQGKASVLQTDSAPWKVFFDDLICDHDWHPINFDNVKTCQKNRITSLKSGGVAEGNTFLYRRNLQGSNEFEIRLNDNCNIFRYENMPTNSLGHY